LPLPRSTWLANVQLLVAREQAATIAGLTLAIKGGHNDENHNHNDVGSFIAALDATPVLIDLGQPTYTAISFSDRRYEQWVVRSEWHNLPVVDGQEQPPGVRWRATDLAVRREEAFDSLELSLAEAYPAGRLKRSATLDRSAQEIRIGDEWDEGVRVEEHFVIGGEPTAHEPGELLVKTLAGGLARLSWDPALGSGRLERRPVNDELLEGVWGLDVHRLIIDTGPDRTTFELKFTRGSTHD
jgi:hypothetical protein